MIVYDRECIEPYTLTDPDGQTASVEVGRSYTVSAERPSTDGPIVVVFSRYWFPVPVKCFGPEHPLGWKHNRAKVAPPRPAINEVR
jgi:hypothetical protein